MMNTIKKLTYCLLFLLISPSNTMDSEEQKRKVALQILRADLEKHTQMASAFSPALGTSPISETISPTNTTDSKEQKRKAALQILQADLEKHEQMASVFSTKANTFSRTEDNPA